MGLPLSHATPANHFCEIWREIGLAASVLGPFEPVCRFNLPAFLKTANLLGFCGKDFLDQISLYIVALNQVVTIYSHISLEFSAKYCFAQVATTTSIPVFPKFPFTPHEIPCHTDCTVMIAVISKAGAA